jgi:four helix bundle protein
VGIASHRDLIVWQKGMKLAIEVYRLSKLMPKEEQYRLTSQLLRAVASVPANIAEGHARGTRKDYANFINIARGSLAEVETLLELAYSVGLLKPADVATAMSLADEIGRMLTALSARLREAPLKPNP